MHQRLLLTEAEVVVAPVEIVAPAVLVAIAVRAVPVEIVAVALVVVARVRVAHVVVALIRAKEMQRQVLSCLKKLFSSIVAPKW